MVDSPTVPVTDRTAHRRKKERGSHDRVLIDAIVDEALICHVGFAIEGRPWVFPTIHVRIGDDVYFHGAPANFGLRTLASGAEVCATFTLIDGLVLAKSAFHHSMNYRSVMLFGTATAVNDIDEKLRVSEAIVDHLVLGRAADCRLPTPEELRATLMVRVPIAEASAKVRTGGPIDDEDDLALPYWAGVIPLTTVAGAPVTATEETAVVPEYARTWSRRP